MIKKFIYKLYYRNELKCLERNYKKERITEYEYQLMKEYFLDCLRNL